MVEAAAASFVLLLAGIACRGLYNAYRELWEDYQQTAKEIDEHNQELMARKLAELENPPTNLEGEVDLQPSNTGAAGFMLDIKPGRISITNVRCVKPEDLVDHTSDHPNNPTIEL